MRPHACTDGLWHAHRDPCVAGRSVDVVLAGSVETQIDAAVRTADALEFHLTRNFDEIFGAQVSPALRRPHGADVNRITGSDYVDLDSVAQLRRGRVLGAGNVHRILFPA